MTSTWVLPGDLTAAQHARRHVTAELEAESVDDEVVDDAVLIASELAANAIRHGEPPASLSLEYRDNRVRISVHDSGRGPGPQVQEPSDTAGSGRGLAMIQQIGVDHGWDRDEDGLTVWAELELRPRPTR